MSPLFNSLIYAAALGIIALLLHPLDKQPWFVWIPALSVIAAILAHLLQDVWTYSAAATWFNLLSGVLLFWCVTSIRLVITGSGGHHGHA